MFLSVYEKLEQQRELLINRVSTLSEDQYFASHKSKWSVAQILTHLLVSERLSLGYMKKKSLGIQTLKDSGIKHKLLLVLLKVSQRFPFRYTAPRVVIDQTPVALPLAELIKQWNEVRSDLKDFLTNIKSDHINRLIYKHPVVGMLDARQAVVFFYEHVNHHRPQIKQRSAIHPVAS